MNVKELIKILKESFTGDEEPIIVLADINTPHSLHIGTVDGVLIQKK